MKLIVLILLSLSLAHATDLKEEYSSDSCSPFELPSKLQDFTDINKKLLHHQSEKFYLYFSADRLEDLQDLKNCLDYSMCGTYQESIVDDPKNYRMHIWKDMTRDQLIEFVRSCPAKNLSSKLVVRRGGQDGQNVDVSKIKKNPFAQMALIKKASPAFNKKISDSTATVNKISRLLQSNQVDVANKMIVATWGINLHGYQIHYTGKPGSFATTNHQDRKISFGKDWIANTCDYIRMIRHEAEHVAQVHRFRECKGGHNFTDHAKRERAAHLNDARFLNDVCNDNDDGKRVRNFCLSRFRDHYMNDKK